MSIPGYVPLTSRNLMLNTAKKPLESLKGKKPTTTPNQSAGVISSVAIGGARAVRDLVVLIVKIPVYVVAFVLVVVGGTLGVIPGLIGGLVMCYKLAPLGFAAGFSSLPESLGQALPLRAVAGVTCAILWVVFGIVYGGSTGVNLGANPGNQFLELVTKKIDGIFYEKID